MDNSFDLARSINRAPQDNGLWFRLYKISNPDEDLPQLLQLLDLGTRGFASIARSAEENGFLRWAAALYGRVLQAGETPDESLESPLWRKADRISSDLIEASTADEVDGDAMIKALIHALIQSRYPQPIVLDDQGSFALDVETREYQHLLESRGRAASDWTTVWKTHRPGIRLLRTSSAESLLATWIALQNPDFQYCVRRALEGWHPRSDCDSCGETRHIPLYYLSGSLVDFTNHTRQCTQCGRFCSSWLVLEGRPDLSELLRGLHLLTGILEEVRLDIGGSDIAAQFVAGSEPDKIAALQARLEPHYPQLRMPVPNPRFTRLTCEDTAVPVGCERYEVEIPGPGGQAKLRDYLAQASEKQIEAYENM